MGDLLSDSVTEDDDCTLNPDQETCLVYFFSASVNISAGLTHRRQGDEINSVTRGLMKLLPVLMRKYKNNFTDETSKLTAVVNLIRLMDFEMYLSLRMHTVRQHRVIFLASTSPLQ